jgi:hypothetical protein
MKNEAVKNKNPENQSGFLAFWEKYFYHVRAFLRSPYTLLVLVLFCIITPVFCLISMYRLYGNLDIGVNARIKEEAVRNAENLTLMENRILERTEHAEQTLTAAINDSTEETLKAISNYNMTYQSLLDAQRRRTLESFYKEDALTAEKRDAARAFAEGRYVTAAKLYGEIATAHPDDQEARFYQYYALFLNNKQDRNNYRIIRDAMNTLERQGYSRKELTETLDYIAAETETTGEKP